MSHLRRSTKPIDDPKAAHRYQKEFSEHLSTFYRKPVFWSSSYYVASTGGAPIEKIKQYIQSQEAPNE
jgi:putative transposase